MLAIGVHPYVTGAAHRIKYFEELYDYINKHAGVVHWTGQQIHDWYAEQVPRLARMSAAIPGLRVEAPGCRLRSSGYADSPR